VACPVHQEKVCGAPLAFSTVSYFIRSSSVAISFNSKRDTGVPHSSSTRTRGQRNFRCWWTGRRALLTEGAFTAIPNACARQNDKAFSHTRPRVARPQDGIDPRPRGRSNSDAYYEPNSFTGPVQDEGFKEPPLAISGNADRYDHRKGNDDYRQPGELFRLIGHPAQQRLLDNTAEAMRGVPFEIVKRWIAHCYKADPEYGEGLAARMGVAASEPPSAAAAE
jgi:Catalase-related immune-responsive